MTNTMQEIATVIAASLRRQGLTSVAAENMAEAVLLDLCRQFGGQNIYMPKGARLESQRRAARIAAARDRGEPVKDIARKQGLCERAVHNNLARAQTEKGKGFTSQPQDEPATLWQADIFLG